MAKFKAHDSVMKDGGWAVYTVEQIHIAPGSETRYWVQEGSDFASRVWANESELELAPQALSTPSESKPVGKTKVIKGHKEGRRGSLKKKREPKRGGKPSPRKR